VTGYAHLGWKGFSSSRSSVPTPIDIAISPSDTESVRITTRRRPRIKVSPRTAGRRGSTKLSTDYSPSFGYRGSRSPAPQTPPTNDLSKLPGGKSLATPQLFTWSRRPECLAGQVSEQRHSLSALLRPGCVLDPATRSCGVGGIHYWFPTAKTRSSLSKGAEGVGRKAQAPPFPDAGRAPTHQAVPRCGEATAAWPPHREPTPAWPGCSGPRGQTRFT
jgi:hypothetical protein